MNGTALPTHIGLRLVEAYPALDRSGDQVRSGYVITIDGRTQWVADAQFEALYRSVGALDFPRALFAALNGNAVARKVWRNSERIVARDEALWLEVPGSEAKKWRPDQVEVFATDWMVVG